MLAQNFKTAADLRIADVELDALIKVLGMLEREEIAPEQFNMCRYCGTACCLAGWAYIASGEIAFPEVADNTPRSPAHGNDGLSTLFCSRLGLGLRATPSQAAIALRSYLTTGDANWAEALT